MFQGVENVVYDQEQDLQAMLGIQKIPIQDGGNIEGRSAANVKNADLEKVTDIVEKPSQIVNKSPMANDYIDARFL